MSKKALKRRGSSKAGRPKRVGERFPCGRLRVTDTPNATTLLRRAELCDDPTMATNPLDAAFANGWLTQGEYRTGARYAQLRRAASPGRPGLASGSNQETASSQVEGVPILAKSLWANMPDREVGAVWDAAFRDVPDAQDHAHADKRESAARDMVGRAERAMSRDERAEVEMVCITQEFPHWFMARKRGNMKHVGFVRLVSGLRAIARAWRPEAANESGSTIAPVPYRPPMHGVPVERLRYVNENGEELLVVERVRRATA